MSIRPFEWAVMIERIHDRDMDAWVLGWSMPIHFRTCTSCGTPRRSTAGSNYAGFSDEEADEIIEEACRLSFDRDERIAKFHRFQEILHEEQPYTFMFSPSCPAGGGQARAQYGHLPHGPDAARSTGVVRAGRPLQRYGQVSRGRTSRLEDLHPPASAADYSDVYRASA